MGPASALHACSQNLADAEGGSCSGVLKAVGCLHTPPPQTQDLKEMSEGRV